MEYTPSSSSSQYRSPQAISPQAIPPQTMPPHTGEIPYEKRVGIICLRITCGFTFTQIAEKLGLKMPSVHQLYSRALERTDPSLRESFVDVAKNVKDAPRSGRPVTNPNKTRASRKGKSRRSKNPDKTREIPGKPVEEQQPLPITDPKGPSNLMNGVTASEVVSQSTHGDPTPSNPPSHSQPQGPVTSMVWPNPSQHPTTN
jgi:hypothetical protein